MEQQLRKKSLHTDTTISGLSLDDIMQRDIKQEFQINDLYESLNNNKQIEHAYRDLNRYK